MIPHSFLNTTNPTVQTQEIVFVRLVVCEQRWLTSRIGICPWDFVRSMTLQMEIQSHSEKKHFIPKFAFQNNQAVLLLGMITVDKGNDKIPAQLIFHGNAI